MKELGKEQVSLSLHSDSQSVIDLAKNPVYHDKTKHVDVQYHFIRTFLKDGVLSLVKIHTSQNPVHVDQGGHDEEAENLLSLNGSSRVKI